MRRLVPRLDACLHAKTRRARRRRRVHAAVRLADVSPVRKPVRSGRSLLGGLGALFQPFHTAVAGLALYAFSQLLSHMCAGSYQNTARQVKHCGLPWAAVHPIVSAMTNPFDDRAGSWDDHPGRRRMADGIFDAICRRIPLQPDWDTLDYGAGTGLLTLALAPRVRHVTALDSSPGMLAVLAEKTRSAGIANIDIRPGDFQTDPPPPGPFHLVVSAMTLHHVRDVEAMLNTFFRLLAPAGRLAIADLEEEDGTFHSTPHNVHHHGFNRRAFARHLADAGFEAVEFTAAAESEKNGRRYPLFLATARRPA